MAKAGKPRFKLSGDFTEWSQLVRGDVSAAAERVASSMDVPSDIPVSVTHKTGNDGRPVSIVTLAHASGLARQAKRGTLTRAAAENGLEVTRYKER